MKNRWELSPEERYARVAQGISKLVFGWYFCGCLLPTLAAGAFIIAAILWGAFQSIFLGA